MEVLLFTVQSKMRANNQKVYMPREGKLISDINKVSSDEVCTSFLTLLQNTDFLFFSSNNCNFYRQTVLLFSVFFYHRCKFDVVQFVKIPPPFFLFILFSGVGAA